MGFGISCWICGIKKCIELRFNNPRVQGESKQKGYECLVRGKWEGIIKNKLDVEKGESLVFELLEIKLKNKVEFC